jgi:hypothetical protein
MPCPQGVAIPTIFECYNRGRVYDSWSTAKAGYAGIGAGSWDPGRKASFCTDCGGCEPKCPQHIQIRARLKEAAAALA